MGPWDEMASCCTTVSKLVCITGDFDIELTISFHGKFTLGRCFREKDWQYSRKSAGLSKKACQTMRISRIEKVSHTTYSYERRCYTHPQEVEMNDRT